MPVDPRATKGTPPMAKIEDVLGFWFAPGMGARWFKKDDAFDAEVKAKLGPAYAMAAAGTLGPWKQSARGCLALVILLDQVPRNLFRGDAQAFATDADARAVTRHALAEGFDQTLGQSERLFLYLPLEHSEELTDQEDCCRLVAALDEEPAWHDYALRHREVIARFGRFPHRNAILGRASSREEEDFLAEPGSSF